jgi:hypothetical protein
VNQSRLKGDEVPSVTEGEAQERAELATDIAYEIFPDRYFSEALPALGGMNSWAQQRLGWLLFPSTLCDAATTAAAQATLARGTLPEDLRTAVAGNAAITSEVLASRRCCTPPFVPRA